MIYNKIDSENIACAIACCFCLNIEIKEILKNIKNIQSPPGRSESIKNNKGYKIIIDYAHTPDALKNILLIQTVNNVKPNILFGCGGNRDRFKRSKMGHIARMYAEKIYITDDNPRDEDPYSIRKSILHGCENGIEIPDRKKAIFKAIHDLKKNETLIIAGKGHEKFQFIKKIKKKFDDIKMAKLALKNK
jgi:UDP-N-acetylmuramyl tripeptide synthase